MVLLSVLPDRRHQQHVAPVRLASLPANLLCSLATKRLRSMDVLIENRLQHAVWVQRLHRPKHLLPLVQESDELVVVQLDLYEVMEVEDADLRLTLLTRLKLREAHLPELAPEGQLFFHVVDGPLVSPDNMTERPKASLVSEDGDATRSFTLAKVTHGVCLHKPISPLAHCQGLRIRHAATKRELPIAELGRRR